MNIVLGKCIESAVKNNIKVLIPRMKWDNYLKMHFRENDEIQALDVDGKCKPGDWILLRETEQRISLTVKHKVERIIYKNGQMVDPITNKPTVGWHLEEDLESDSRLFGLKPVTERFTDMDSVPKPKPNPRKR